MPRLILQLDDQVLKEYEMGATATIGRLSDNSVAIDSPAVSSHHACVFRDGDQFVAYVALGDGRFETRKVRTGRKGDGFVEVLDGLSAGESVAVSGTFVLKSEASKESLGGEE